MRADRYQLEHLADLVFVWDMVWDGEHIATIYIRQLQDHYSRSGNQYWTKCIWISSGYASEMEEEGLLEQVESDCGMYALWRYFNHDTSFRFLITACLSLDFHFRSFGFSATDWKNVVQLVELDDSLGALVGSSASLDIE